MDTIVEYGTDIDKEWSFKDGDLVVVSDEDNLTQALLNRLNTLPTVLDLFYEDYGSILTNFLGWKRNDTTLSFIKLELDRVISSDPRITDFESNVRFGDTVDSVIIDLRVFYSEVESLDLNFVLGVTGVDILTEEEDDVSVMEEV